MAEPSLIDSIKEGTVEQNERLMKALSWLCAGGRLTDHEHATLKKLAPRPIQGWEWDEQVRMWKRRDFADVEQITKLASTLEDQARLMRHIQAGLVDLRERCSPKATAIEEVVITKIDALLTKLNAFGERDE